MVVYVLVFSLFTFFFVLFFSIAELWRLNPRHLIVGGECHEGHREIDLWKEEKP